jgi:peptidoglycan/xylan/chitin deacetylase (PgdA/CDA1 family)
LLLIYHGTTVSGGGRANLHLLPQAKLAEQIEHLAQRRYPLISWREDRLSTDDGRTRIGITFDDGYRSDLANAHLLKTHGFDALFFVATEYIGQENYMNQAELRQLRALGMSVGSHSHHHTLLAPMSTEQIRRELGQSKQILEDVLQQPVLDFSFPGGSYDRRVLDVGRELGYRRFFSSDWGVNGVRQTELAVYRRSSVLNNMSIEQFDALLQCRGYLVRQMQFKAKEWAKRAVGEDRYVRLREAFLNFGR